MPSRRTCGSGETIRPTICASSDASGPAKMRDDVLEHRRPAEQEQRHRGPSGRRPSRRRRASRTRRAGRPAARAGRGGTPSRRTRSAAAPRSSRNASASRSGEASITLTLTSSVTWTPRRIEAKRTAIPAKGMISATAVALSESRERQQRAVRRRERDRREHARRRGRRARSSPSSGRRAPATPEPRRSQSWPRQYERGVGRRRRWTARTRRTRAPPATGQSSAAGTSGQSGRGSAFRLPRPVLLHALVPDPASGRELDALALRLPETGVPRLVQVRGVRRCGREQKQGANEHPGEEQ